MKNLSSMLKVFGLLGVLAVVVSAGHAQNREKFGISAKAGGVNSVSGTVTVTRAGQAAQLLSSRDDLSAGDAVSTGETGQVEVLLNPGTYLRVAANSQFVLVDNSLDNLVVSLVKGSAIIEATGGEDAYLAINVLTKQKRLVIIRSGIYRFNVQPASTELLVRKGRVLVENSLRDVVKGGMKVIFGTGGPIVAKLSKQDQDDFDLWSKDRAETLARANKRISGRDVYGYLAGLSAYDWSFSAANPWGLWAYSPFARSYTFVPYHYGWSSPYGHSYGNYCPVGYHGGGGYYGPGNNGTVVRNPGWPGGGSSGSGGSSGGSSGGFSGGGSGGSSGGSSSVGPSAPSPSMGSQAGPRDPDSGSRSINRIKDN